MTCETPMILSAVEFSPAPWISTPLLDWSRSPYIAAFFALENRPTVNNEEDCSRIYIFNAMAWRLDTAQVSNIADPRPTITPLEFQAHNNPRYLPQQSVHTYTNIEDPEAWIRLTEEKKGKKYLTVIDVPRTTCVCDARPCIHGRHRCRAFSGFGRRLPLIKGEVFSVGLAAR